MTDTTPPADATRAAGAWRWGIGLVIYVSLAVPAVIWLPEALVNQSLTRTPVTDALTPAEAAAAITAARQAVLLSAGGLLGVFTLFLTQRRDSLARARHEIDRQKHEIDRDANRTTRYTEAIKQLGDDDHSAIRPGGIYALERLAIDSPRDRQTILDVLTSWTRGASPLQDPGVRELHPLPMDVAAAVVVVGRITQLSPPRASIVLNGSHLFLAKFPGAVLEGAEFHGAELFNADFTHAKLDHAMFVEANLAAASFEGADLTEARFAGANLGMALLRDADVSGADFSNASLEGANFSETKGLTTYQVESARGWSHETRWPAGFLPPTAEREGTPIRRAFPSA